MDFQVVRENALKYLGYQAPMFEGLTLGISSLLGECIEQIEQPKVKVKRFKLAKDPLRLEESGDEILGQQMEDMLEDCEECILIGCTLGIVMERKIKFYAKVNMTKSTVMDAAASAYLEEYCDRYEETLGFDNRTYRACPGYGDFPLELQGQFLDILDAPKRIGVCVNSSMMLTPTKSVTCVIGLGHNLKVSSKKNCDFCNFKDKCQFRKQGTTCS